MARRRTRTTTASLAAVVALLGAALVAVAPLAPPPAGAVVGECPDGTLPGPGNANPIWTDQNVSAFAGQDFGATNSAAELEGVLVVGADATFDRSSAGTFNVGWVGVGSGVAPYPGSVMLAAGGDVTVGANTVLDVGSGAIDENGDLLGGDVNVGGVTSPDYEASGARYELNNGTLTEGMGAAAIAAWADWGSQISQESAAFAGLPDTGQVSVGQFLTFTGDGTSDPQVFSLDASVLAGNPAIDFVNLADDVPVIINVNGSAPITWAPNWISQNGVRVDDFSSPLFGPVSQRTLWNFPESTSVHVAGSSQVLGSILVPGANSDPSQPTLRVTASTNGRLYTNGSILMDGVGNEHHNYPWLTDPFECIPIDVESVDGQITIEKELAPGGADFLPADATVHGVVVCALPDGGRLVVEWEATPGTPTVVPGLPVGATCAITESLGSASRDYFLRPGQVDVARVFAWEDPVWSVNGVDTPPPVTFVVPDPEDTTQITIGVENALSLGSFAIEKVVVGEGAPAVGFTGTWSCELPAGTVVASGEWTLAAGQTSEAFVAPVGAVCSVTEVSPADPSNGDWEAPVLSPASVTITADSATTPLTFAVTNAFAATGGPGDGGGEAGGGGSGTGSGGSTGGGGTLPATGGAIAPWAIPLGVGALIAGLLLRFGRRRSV